MDVVYEFDIIFDNFMDEYNKLLSYDKYISKKEYQRFLDKYKDLFNKINDLTFSNYKKNLLKTISNDIDNQISIHNEQFIDRKMVEYKDYFDNIFKDIDPVILLDDEQRKAILIDEDYSLVIAGAGSGKTTTMTAKVKYLIDKCNVKPEEIAVLSFTNKAVEELDNRINDDFKLGIKIKTFHKLGLEILNDTTNIKLSTIDDSYKNKLIYDYFKDYVFIDKKKLTYYMDNFSKYLHFSPETLKYDTFDEYYDYYTDWKYKQQKDNLREYINSRIEKRLITNRSIKNEQLKSKPEVIIANFLYINGIDYSYEQRHKESERQISYKPDFTVSLPNGKKIYIEYYGLSIYDKNSTYSEKEILEYRNIIRKKKILHDKYGTDLIELYPDKKLSNTNYLDILTKELNKRGIYFNEKTDKEIFLKIMETSKNSQLINFTSIVTQFIAQFKCNNYSEDDFEFLKNKTNNNLVKLQLTSLKEIYKYYNRAIHSQYLIDFEDMINLSIKCMKSNNPSDNKIKYKYIIVDEFQDISKQRFNLLQCISDSYDAKIIGVGDDWQAIFGFSGADINLFTHFCELMGYGEIIKITNTYRNSQELIDIAGKFVLQNNNQFEKYLHSPKKLPNPIEIVYYDNDIPNSQVKILESIILNIYKKNPEHRILLLGRYNNDKEMITKTSLFRDGVIKNDEIIYVKNNKIKLNFLTIHSAKGLGYDQVILINALDDAEFGFPSKIKDDPIISILKNSKNEGIEFPEERRLFYVAITRTKNKIYILAPRTNISSFINEIKEYDNVLENRDFLEEIEII